MNQQIKRWRRAWSVLAGTLAAVALVACGGGDGGVGSGGTGIVAGASVGTVNGLGSLIVDGKSYENRHALVVREAAPRKYVVTDVNLGHRVSVEYDSDGVANIVQVEAALVGVVTSVDTTASQISILGQKVTINSNGAMGPVTQLGGGYRTFDNLVAGDPIEVHGVLVPIEGASYFQATRIDKLSKLPDFLRVTGLVRQLRMGRTNTFALGAMTVDATDSVIVPAGGALANWQMVTVLAQPSALQGQDQGTLTLRAGQVRIREIHGGGGLDDFVSGTVTHLDHSKKNFLLSGLKVNFESATILPAGSTLGRLQYVQVHGSVAPDGSLKATSVTIRDATAQVQGNISRYVSTKPKIIFGVRDVLVLATDASIQDCPQDGLADGLFVTIEGTMRNIGIVAHTVRCVDEPSDATIERGGLASDVDDLHQKFSLKLQKISKTVTVQWTDRTYFSEGVSPDKLNGESLHVEGWWENGILRANKIGPMGGVSSGK